MISNQRLALGSRGAERAHEHQHRVRLFVQVLFAIDVLTHASDVAAQFIFDPAILSSDGIVESSLWAWASTASTLVVWLVLKRFELPLRVTGAIEILVTLWRTLSASFMIALAFGSTMFTPSLGLLVAVLLLALRAGLIPSTTMRTAGVGVGTMAIVAWVFFRSDYPGHDLLNYSLTVIALAHVVVTSVISHTIYGLREEVDGIKKFGQYVLGKKLGEGGMGVVYAASHSMLRRDAAIKLLHRTRSAELDQARFEREVQLTARLSHPNIVTVFDYGKTEGGTLYHVMELLDGATLDEVVELTGAQPEARVLRILRDVTNALADAHAIGLVHRDIKPSNIMLCCQGRRHDVVKVLDFGLGKPLRDGDAKLTHAGETLGTPLYMSPEVVVDPAQVDERSDIYALGAVAYFLAVGQHVFQGRSVIEVCAHHLHSEPSFPDGACERLSAPLRGLILDCLAKSPADRPQSASELLGRIQQIRPHDSFDADEWWDEYELAIRALKAESEPAAARLAVLPR